MPPSVKRSGTTTALMRPGRRRSTSAERSAGFVR